LNDSASDAQTAAVNFFNANFPANFMGSINTTITPTANHNSDGSWTINVSATTVTPTYFGRIFGQTGTTVGASAEAISKTLDVMLVLDFSTSLVMAGAVPDLKAAASNFLNVFSEGDDRVGMVFFSNGAIIPANCAIRNPARGFTRSTLQSAITNVVVPANGSTNSAEAMRIARAEMNAIPAAQRGSLRVIVFFTDGLPNVANFNLGTPASPRGLSSMDLNGSRANPFYLNVLESLAPGSYATFPSLDNHVRSDISSLDTQAEADANSVDLATYNPGFRQLAFPGGIATNNQCNVNMAARSQLEYFADQARAEGIIIYSIGLGNMTTMEVMCPGYIPANESGEAVLRRIAASPGVFVNASDHSQLNSAFQAVAKLILRLTR
jgi:hypothetical protein